MQMTSLIAASLALLMGSTQAATHYGTCANDGAKPMDNFDLSRYLGRWYQIKIDSEDFDETQSCNASEIVQHYDSTVTMSIN